MCENVKREFCERNEGRKPSEQIFRGFAEEKKRINQEVPFL